MKPAIFKYTFNFDNDIVVYEYKKWDPDNLVSEKLTVNDKTLIDYYYGNEASYNNFIDDSIKGSLNIKLVDNKLSVIKYIYRNTPIMTRLIVTEASMTMGISLSLYSTVIPSDSSELSLR